jgi:Icc-related predicted phosphoesterase
MKILMFTTTPAHKGLEEPGSEVVAELIKTHRARFALVPGDEPIAEWLGKTLVVAPGRFDEGKCTFIDLQERAIEADTLAEEVLTSA